MAEPLSAFYSTYLNNRIDTIDKLGVRNLRQLGCPLQKLEIAIDQAREFAAMAIEMYTRYAGYTEEYLLFHSDLYRKGVGLKIDELVSTATPELSARYDENDPNTVVGYDYELEDYRRVVDVVNFEEGSSTGVNILFSVQASLMQSLGYNFYGAGGSKTFDLISWYNLNEYLELRNKLISNKVYFRFDADNQLLKLFPEPNSNFKYYGLIKCYVEKRVRDCLKSLFVQKYSLALTKIAIGTVRGRFSGTQLLGGGTVNYNDMLQQGLAEKDKLEEQLLNGTGGFADMLPPSFLVY
jgi:hypothetical protein